MLNDQTLALPSRDTKDPLGLKSCVSTIPSDGNPVQSRPSLPRGLRSSQPVILAGELRGASQRRLLFTDTQGRQSIIHPFANATPNPPANVPNNKTPVLTSLCHLHLLTISPVPHVLSLSILPFSPLAYVNAIGSSLCLPATLCARRLNAPFVFLRKVSAYGTPDELISAARA